MAVGIFHKKKTALKQITIVRRFILRLLFLFELESVYKLTVFPKVVIPAKAGIQFFQDLLDAGSRPA